MAEAIEGIALVHDDRAGAAAKLFAQPDHAFELGLGQRIAPPRVLRRGQGRKSVESLAGPVDPLVLVVGLHGLSRQAM